MVDLFDFAPAPVVSSGPVPRELVPGVVWDDAAEADFRKAHEELRSRFGGKWAAPQFADDAVREARWAVEIRLHQRFIKARMEEASRVWEPDEKRALVARWRREYGNARADELVGLAKSDHFRKVVREAW